MVERSHLENPMTLTIDIELPAELHRLLIIAIRQEESVLGRRPAP